nr:unnamed protein product [Spirometra erinaceieuropaei]
MQLIYWLLFFLFAGSSSGVGENNENDLNVQVLATSSQSIRVTWRLPSGYSSRDLKNYDLYLLGHSSLVQRSVQPETTSCTFAGLPPFTNFSVDVQPVFTGATKPVLHGGASAITWPTG